MNSDMSILIMASRSWNSSSDQHAGELGFTDAGGPQEDEAADGPALVGDAGARAADAAGDGLHGLVLADDAALEGFFELEQAFDLGLDEARGRDAGHERDDLGDVFGCNLDGGVGGAFLELELGEAVLDDRFAGLEAGGQLEVLVEDGVFDVVADFVELLLQVAQALLEPPRLMRASEAARRPGRWPCRAGSGRRRSAWPAWPRPRWPRR
jgi:hypothetical protein